ncbi:hypothetical protein, partial [Streptomyces sp. NPDC002530]
AAHLGGFTVWPVHPHPEKMLHEPLRATVRVAHRDETPVSVVGLNATDEAAALYASYGFAPPRHSYVQFTPVRQGAARPVG